MGWLNVDEGTFYGAVWAVGFLAALAAASSPNAAEHFGKRYRIASISGFLSFATVAILVGRISSPIVGHWYWLGVAALIGLSGNQQEVIRQKLIDIIFNAFRGGTGTGGAPQ